MIATSAVTADLRRDAGSGQFVTICADGQSVRVELDHSGAPIDPRHHCPDCISVAALIHAQAQVAPVYVESRLFGARAALSQKGSAIPNASARAPPLGV